MSFPISLFKVLCAATAIRIGDDEMHQMYIIETGAGGIAYLRENALSKNPQPIMIETISDEFFSFDDQLVLVDDKGRLNAALVGGGTVSMTLEVKRPVTSQDVLAFFQQE